MSAKTYKSEKKDFLNYNKKNEKINNNRIS